MSDFCDIAWMTEGKWKKGVGSKDFVSGYAMTNCLENFAESYAYYVLHHESFKARIADSTSLNQKYFFIKNRVFKSLEFNTNHKKLILMKIFGTLLNLTLI